MTSTVQSGFSRRTFVKGSTLGALGLTLGAAGAGSLFGCSSTEGDAPTVDETPESIVWNHCAVNCGCACALQCHVKGDEIVYIESDNLGDGALGSSQARACLKGRAIRRWLQSPDRLNYPMKRKEGTKRGDGEYEQISWDEAIDLLYEKLKYTIDTYGNEAVHFHYSSGVCSGAMMLGYSVKRLFNLIGGCLNYYGTYSSAQLTAGTTYTYGGGNGGSSLGTIQEGQLVVMFGNNPAITRMGGGGLGHDFPYMMETKKPKLIIIDYRMNNSLANQGGEWIPIRPGTDGALCAALAYVFITNGYTDEEFLSKYCVGYDEKTLPEGAAANSSFKAYILGEGPDGTPKTPEWAAAITQIPAKRIEDLGHEMGKADPVFICQGKGPQRHSNGEITTRMIMVLPQLLGQIGKPGTSDGRETGTTSLPLGIMPIGTNPVTTNIPCFMWPAAIRDMKSFTPLNSGLRGAETVDTNIKFIFNYAGNCLTNQHSDINTTHDLLQDESLVEFIVTSEVFMTDSAKYSDLILPDQTTQEQVDVVALSGGEIEEILFAQPVYEPKFERRGIYEVCCDLAEKFGVLDEFTDGGKTREDWCKSIYETFRESYPDAPTWEDGVAMGIWKTGNVPAPIVKLQAFVEDPEANPLPTPSGKIDIYSTTLADFAATWELAEDEVISPIPEFDPGFESYVNVTDEYPLLIAGFHHRSTTHSSYANNEIIQTAVRHQAWINPADAEPRGIKDGDMVAITTARGEIRIEAKVTPLIIPGAVGLAQGMWHNADMNGDRVDHGGCINTLTTERPSPLAKANPQHSNIGQVTKVV
ncbi:MAG: molybdopterin-dependent oxidoreductase [Eggerthellaceae bacterium]|nr:molybdopterin-dependent oxidoreductase [Eggerthellaceae bacterium]